RAPVFGGGPNRMKPPSPSGKIFERDEDTDGDTTPSTVVSLPNTKARRFSSDLGGDIEDGNWRALGTDGSKAAPKVVSQDMSAAVSRILEGIGDEETMVLPRAPNDDEKFSYLNTRRWGFIPLALLSFLTMSVGMWLFTIAHPAFYWFGLPSTFLIVYLGCHYLAVALWGKDFSFQAHEEVVRMSKKLQFEPTVDVFLPVCREPAYLLANTWKHVWAMEYPNFTVHVLDDGAQDEVKALAEAFGFNYIVRPDRPMLKKAGNLRHAFSRTSGEAIAIFDADFCPRSDFLSETVPYLSQDESIGIVQTPQYFRYRKEQTWVEQGAGISQEFFYRMVQVNQDRFSAAVCVGSCGVYRRRALEPFGGVAAVAHSEDMYTGFKMTEAGYTIKYVPLPSAMGTCPDDPPSFFMQQYRWAMGSATLVMDKEFWRSHIPTIHKICFLNGLLYYTATALMLFLGPMPFLLLVWAHADDIIWYHSGFVLPAILCSAFLMPLWSTQRYGAACHRVRVIQCYAHLYAIKDRLMGKSAPWVPSGAGASRRSSTTYKSSVCLLIAWNFLLLVVVVGGCIWRMTELVWYQFVPALAIVVGSFVLNISTLYFRRK
ncbi:unnamed protein product, partial [Ascophyllum nodosum]